MTQNTSVLPPVPRELTARVRQRAWSDPRVRVWWMAAAILGLVVLGFVISALRDRQHEAWLIHDGLLIDARVLTADNETVKGRPERPDSLVELQFITGKFKDYRPHARVLEGRREYITTWSILPVHVNPNDPEDWTWLSEPLPLITRMIGAVVVFPLALAALAWALRLRYLTLQVWREGKLLEALVVESRHIAVAPMCRVARVTPADERDQSVYTVYLPPKLARLGRGDSVMILSSARWSKNALAAAWFE